jgi:hypothetical protein
MNCGISRKEECSEECANGKIFQFNLKIQSISDCLGNTEEEMEEYTEMFEHIDEYRSDLKKSSSKKSNKKVVSSDSDGSSTDTTTSDNESDPSSEEEDVPDDKNKKSKTTKKN